MACFSNVGACDITAASDIARALILKKQTTSELVTAEASEASGSVQHVWTQNLIFANENLCISQTSAGNRSRTYVEYPRRWGRFVP